VGGAPIAVLRRYIESQRTPLEAGTSSPA